MPTAKITSKGQITLPKEIRDHLNVDSGDNVIFFLNNRGEVVVDGVGGDVRELKGFLKPRGQRRLSVEDMDAAILRHHARKR
jgi:AbrB family looped-hinge helix DNA binding protein